MTDHPESRYARVIDDYIKKGYDFRNVTIDWWSSQKGVMRQHRRNIKLFACEDCDDRASHGDHRRQGEVLETVRPKHVEEPRSGLISHREDEQGKSQRLRVRG